MRFETVRNVRKIGSAALWKVIPLSLVVAVVSVFLGQQVVQPRHRMVKVGVLAVVLALLVRYPMVYCLYFFVMIMPFPSGVVLTSTNVLLMTLIPLIWLARSRATRAELFKRTEIDKWVFLFVMAHVVSFWNVDTTTALTGGLQMFWRLLTTVAFFYLIVTFIDDEKKLETMMKVAAVSATLVAVTAILELFVPGIEIIPGWISTRRRFGAGLLGYRLEGLRVSGAVGSYDVLSDLCPLNLFVTVPFFLRAKNPIEKTFWLVASGLLFVTLLATATRGGFVSFGVAFLYALWVFRKRLNLVRCVVLICVAVASLLGTQFVLEKYTVAASMTERLAETRFVGLTPDTRVGLYQPILERCMEHIFIGHGPWYETSRGLVRYFWPHNGYLYYVVTVGLFGLSMFLVVAYKLLRMSLRFSHPLATGTFVGLALSIFHVQLVMFLVGQLRTDHQRTTDYLYPYVVWMLFGLIVAANGILKRREATATDVASGVR